MKQTAVEWLIEQLKEYDFADSTDTENYIIKIQSWVLKQKEEQAKAMEKEQIIDCYAEANTELTNEDGSFITGEQYYNETFKQE
jgi:hypothetical protein